MFSEDELKLLIDALDAWEIQPSFKGAMGTMITMMLCPPEQREKESTQEWLRSKQTELEVDTRKRMAILVKAKLVEMLNEVSTGNTFGR